MHISLYAHIPFCADKCRYCDFASGVFPEISRADYVDTLLAEMELRAAALPLPVRVPTLYIGGGTPSLLAPGEIARLIDRAAALFSLEEGAEITLEANPGTFEKERFRAFRAAGVTRLSVGVQSFNDAHLKALGRVHDRAQAVAALEEAALAFDTFNLDLMYALPGQTMAQLEDDLVQAIGFMPPHLSVYHLTIEPNTYFAKFPPRVPDDDLAYAMLDRITEMSSNAGYERYEVSAYAKPGHRCWHNVNYWEFGDYLGLGAGAHGKLSFPHRVVRQVRYREPRLYMDQALAGDAVGQSGEVAGGQLPFEFMLNATRLREGFVLARFTERTGLPLSAIERPLAEAERLGLIERDMTNVRPTQRGFDFLSDLQQLFL